MGQTLNEAALTDEGENHIMKVRYKKITSLPKLAWLAKKEAEVDLVEVLHGPSVELGDGFLVEGIWNNNFEDGGLDDSDCVCGSGMVIYDDYVVFVSAANTVDSLFYHNRGSSLLIANSLPFLLSVLDDELLEHYTKYSDHLNSITKGINKYDRELVTKKGSVTRLMFRNLRLDYTGLSILDKPLAPRFASYEEYSNYLEENCAKLIANARDLARRIPIKIFSTQSKGYDTTASNAIAAKYGIDKVFTCPSARDKGAFFTSERESGGDDDGTEIGRIFGFDCIPIDRLSFEQGFADEEFYYCGSYDIQDVNLDEVNEHVAEVAVLITGILGEIWYGAEHFGPGAYYDGFVNDELMRFDLSGHGLGEVRLHKGLIHFPLPYIGAQRRSDIYKITLSQELDPWRLQTDYDRPIPRRIAEERGVPREFFGQKKLNTTVTSPKPPIPRSPHLRSEYFAFLAENGLLSRHETKLFPIVHRINQVLYYYSPNRYPLLYYLERIICRLLRREWTFETIWKNLDGTLFCFCVNRETRNWARKINISG